MRKLQTRFWLILYNNKTYIILNLNKNFNFLKNIFKPNNDCNEKFKYFYVYKLNSKYYLLYATLLQDMHKIDLSISWIINSIGLYTNLLIM